ncbi:MAG: alpha-E domain-containing protein [Intestinibacter sp.]
MDYISINKKENLHWLGRYLERAYELGIYLKKYYDDMLDDKTDYGEFCNTLGIQNTFKDKDDFILKMVSDPTNTSSIIYSLNCAKNNSIILRNVLTTETISYVQMANCLVEKELSEEINIAKLQEVTDLIMGFWGALHDFCGYGVSYEVLLGKYIERMDLYKRFGEDDEKIGRCSQRIENFERVLDKIINGEIVVI